MGSQFKFSQSDVVVTDNNQEPAVQGVEKTGDPLPAQIEDTSERGRVITLDDDDFGKY
jgi:hypothetical protein